MAFNLSISENSQPWQVIQMIAAEQHVTPEVAAERLLEEAVHLYLKPSEPNLPVIATSDEEYIKQLRERGARRAATRQAVGDPMASIRPDTPEALIGFLCDAPEAAETIRELAYQRRAHDGS